MKKTMLILAALSAFGILLVPGVAGAEESDATQTEAVSNEAPPESAGDEQTTAGDEQTSGSESGTSEEATEEVAEPAEVEGSEDAEADGSSSVDPAPTVPAEQTTSEPVSYNDTPVANVTSVKSTNVTSVKPTSKKKSRRAKGCSASSRVGVSRLIQTRAPPAAGCSRLDGSGNGQIVLPDGTTLTFVETAQGEVTFTVSGGNGTFTGTIFVKGGPDSPGFACTFTGATTGTCHTPVNPNNGKFYDVSHVDACPGQFAPPGTPGGGGPGSGGPGGGGSGGGGSGGGGKPGDAGGGKAGNPGRESGPGASSAAVTAVQAQPGEELAFTGFPAVWLLLLGSGLIGCGTALRLARRD